MKLFALYVILIIYEPLYGRLTERLVVPLNKISVRHFLQNLLLSDEFDIKHKLQNMLLAISLVGSAASIIISFALGFGLAGNLLSLLTTVTAFITFYISVIKKKKTAASYFVSIVINIFLFPLMFILDGGVYSAMPLWFIFGLIFPWLILDGKGCYIIFGLDLLMALGCLALQFFFPDFIVMPQGDNLTRLVAMDIAQAIVIIPVIIGFTIEYQGYAFTQQRKKMEIQEKQLLEAMKIADQANIAKTSFLVNMSHEIRTPINAVLGMDEMILRESNDESILSYASNIQSAGQSLLSLINDVLDFSKIESGKLELLPVEYDVQQLMNDCYSMIIIRAEKKNLLLEIHNDPDMPSKLLGDEVRIRQIIINLLTNAVKYTSSGTVVLNLNCERISEDQIMLKIRVRDTGMGISEENLNNLFMAFNRLDELHNRNIEGTGLGLSITKRLTDMMGGKIGVYSTLGKGSDFWVEIPQKVVSFAPVGVFIENRRAKSGQKKNYRERFQAPGVRILVVDDVKLNIDVMKGLLKNTKIRIDSAYSGKECLGLVQKNTYDMIFMDHLMPEMDGIETLNNMRRIPDSPNKNTPVIVLTANVMVGAKEKYTSLGFTDYIAKPVQSEQLELMLLNYLPEELIISTSQESAPEKENITIMASVNSPELDTTLGIRYCCGNEEFYYKILGMIDLESKADKLDSAFRSSDWKIYERLCCGLKSAALTIGAVQTSELAAELERQAKSGGIAFIREKHNSLIDCCHSLNKTINNYLHKNKSEGDKY